MSKEYRSDAMAAIHETMTALLEAKAIDKTTMRSFDESCLTPSSPSATTNQGTGQRLASTLHGRTELADWTV